MTNLQLLQAIGMIEQELISEAEHPVNTAKKAKSIPPHHMWRQLSVLAACLCLIVGSVILSRISLPPSPGDTAGNGNIDKATGLPADNNLYQGSSSIAGDPTTDTEVREGKLLYYEDFDGYADADPGIGIPAQLGWHALNLQPDSVDSESDVVFALRGGRLYFQHLHTDAYSPSPDGSPTATSPTRGKDAYYAIDLLCREEIKADLTGKYTLEYDLEYLPTSDAHSYAALITELSKDGQTYHVFGFRINGTAIHQCHDHMLQKNFLAEDTSLRQKLLGAEGTAQRSSQAFAGITVTIRLQGDRERGGHIVLMKTGSMAHFVPISLSHAEQEIPSCIDPKNFGVAFKICGATEGYLDHIRLWTGWCEEPNAAVEP